MLLSLAAVVVVTASALSFFMQRAGFAEKLFTAEFYLQGSSPRQFIFRLYNEIVKKGDEEILRHV